MLLAQSRPTDTSVTVLQKNRKGHTTIRMLHVANTSSSAATYSIFLTWGDSKTYDQTTALFYTVDLPANTTDIITYEDGQFVMDRNNIDLAVQSGTGSAITYTLHGREA